MGGRVDRKMTGGGSGVRLSASRRSTTKSHQQTTRPAPWYSLCRPPVLAHWPARPSVPFTLPCSLLPPTQASRAATDVSLFDPPAPPGSGLPRDAIYNGTGNSAHYRPAYADFRSGAWTMVPRGGE